MPQDMADVWVADGGQANIWKRVNSIPHAAVEFGVDLKLGSSAPPTIRSVGVGPDNQAANNVARNRAIRVRDRLAAGGD